MKFFHPLIFIPLCIFSCEKRHQVEVHNDCEYEGTYKTHSFNYGMKLVLRVDHSFDVTSSHHDCFGGENRYIVTGTFSSLDDKIFLSPSNFHVARYETRDTLGRRERVLEEDSTYETSALYDKMWDYEDTLQVVRWNRHMFILGANKGYAARRLFFGYSNKLIELLNIINSNPSKVRNYDTQQRILEMLWNKPCDDCSEESIKKALPEEWRSFIMDVPITGRIVEVQKKESGFDDLYEVILDAGSLSNVHLGMAFMPEKSEKNYSQVIITDVQEKRSKGIVRVFSGAPEISGVLTTEDQE